MNSFKRLVMVMLMLLPGASYADGIIGYFDGIYGQTGNYNAGGWACVPNDYTTLDINVYVASFGGREYQYIGSTKANIDSHEAPIDERCSTRVGRRFAFALSPSILKRYAGEILVVHASSPRYGDSRLTYEGNWYTNRIPSARFDVRGARDTN